MTENDLIELGFNRYDETDPQIGDWYYLAADWNGIELISNASDEWDSDGLYVEVFETNIRFRGSGDLWQMKELIYNNLK